MFNKDEAEAWFTEGFIVGRTFLKAPHTAIPQKHIPKDRIPLAMLQQIALGISLKMTSAKCQEDVIRLHGEAIQEARYTATDLGIVHLIDWTTFLLNA